MGLFENVELIIPPKKQNKTIKVKSLNGYDAIRETYEGNTMTVKSPVVDEKTKPKVSIGLQLN